MTSPNPIPAIAHPPHSSESCNRVPQPARRSCGKRLFTPFALPLLGLGVAVALWGYGYKLSLYHRHPDKTSVNEVAKLWLNERGHGPAGLRAGDHPDRIQASAAQPGEPHVFAAGLPSAGGGSLNSPAPLTCVSFYLFSRPPPLSLSL